MKELADFYVQLTGWEIVRAIPDWITVQTADGQQIGFQQVDSHVPPEWPGQNLPSSSTSTC